MLHQYIKVVEKAHSEQAGENEGSENVFHGLHCNTKMYEHLMPQCSFTDKQWKETPLLIAHDNITQLTVSHAFAVRSTNFFNRFDSVRAGCVGLGGGGCVVVCHVYIISQVFKVSTLKVSIDPIEKINRQPLDAGQVVVVY
jgi:hypothetical protein